MGEYEEIVPSKAELLIRAEQLCYAERTALAGQIGKRHRGSEAVASLIEELICASTQTSRAVGIKSLSGGRSPLMTGTGETMIADNHMSHHLGLIMASSYRQSVFSTCSKSIMASSSSLPSSISIPKIGVGEATLDREWKSSSWFFKNLAAKEVVRQTLDDKLLLQEMQNASAKMQKKLLDACVKQRRLIVLEKYCDLLLEAGKHAKVARILHSCSSCYVREHLSEDMLTREKMMNYHGDILLDLLRESLMAAGGDKHAQKIVWDKWWSKWLGKPSRNLKGFLSTGDARQRCKKFTEILVDFPPHEWIQLHSSVHCQWVVALQPDIQQCLKILFTFSGPKLEEFMTRHGLQIVDGWGIMCVPERCWHFDGLATRRFDQYIHLLRRSAEMTRPSAFWASVKSHLRQEDLSCLSNVHESLFAYKYSIHEISHPNAFSPQSLCLICLTSGQMKEVIWVVRRFLESIKPSSQNWEEWHKGESDITPGPLSLRREDCVQSFNSLVIETLFQLFGRTLDDNEWLLGPCRKFGHSQKSVIKRWGALEAVWEAHWEFLIDGIISADEGFSMQHKPELWVLGSERLWSMVVRFSPRRINMFFDCVELFLERQQARKQQDGRHSDAAICQIYDSFCSAWLERYPTSRHPEQSKDDWWRALPIEFEAEKRAVCDRIVSHWWQKYIMPGLSKGKWNVDSVLSAVQLFSLVSGDLRAQMIRHALHVSSMAYNLSGSEDKVPCVPATHPFSSEMKCSTIHGSGSSDRAVISLLESLLRSDPLMTRSVLSHKINVDYLHTGDWPLLLQLVSLLPNQERYWVATLLQNCQQVKTHFLRHVISMIDLTKDREREELIKDCSLPSSSQRQEASAALYAASLRTGDFVQLERTIRLLVQKVRSTSPPERQMYINLLFGNKDEYLEVCIPAQYHPQVDISGSMSLSARGVIGTSTSQRQHQLESPHSGLPASGSAELLGSKDTSWHRSQEKIMKLVSCAEEQKALWLQLLQDACASFQADQVCKPCSEFASAMLARVAWLGEGSQSASDARFPYSSHECIWWDLGVEMQWRIHARKNGSGEHAQSSFVIELNSWTQSVRGTCDGSVGFEWEHRESWIWKCRQMCDAVYYSHQRLFDDPAFCSSQRTLSCQQIIAMTTACGVLWVEVPRLIESLKEKLALLHDDHGVGRKETSEEAAIRELFVNLLHKHSYGCFIYDYPELDCMSQEFRSHSQAPVQGRKRWYTICVLREFVRGELQEQKRGRAFDVAFMWYIDRVVCSERNGLSRMAAKREAVTWLISQCASAIHLRFVQHVMLLYAQDLLTPFLRKEGPFEGRFCFDPRISKERLEYPAKQRSVIVAGSDLHRLSTAQCNMLLEQLGCDCAEMDVPLERRIESAQLITSLPVFSPSCLMAVLARWGGAEMVDASEITVQADTASYYLSDESDYVMCPSDNFALSREQEETGRNMPTRVSCVASQVESALACDHFEDYAPSLPAAVLRALFKGLIRVHEPLGALPLATSVPVAAAFPFEVSWPFIWHILALCPPHVTWRAVEQLVMVASQKGMRTVSIMKAGIRFAVSIVQKPAPAAGEYSKVLKFLQGMWYGTSTHRDILFAILHEVARMAVQPSNSSEVLEVAWKILRSSLTRCRSNKELLAALMLGIPEHFVDSNSNSWDGYFKHGFGDLATQAKALCDLLSERPTFTIPKEKCRQYFETLIAPICEHSRTSVTETGSWSIPSPFDWTIHAYAVVSLERWAAKQLHDMGFQPQVALLAKQVALDLSIAFILHPNPEVRSVNWRMQSRCIKVLHQVGGMTGQLAHNVGNIAYSRPMCPNNQDLVEVLSVYSSLLQLRGHGHHHNMGEWNREWRAFAPLSPSLPLWVVRMMREHVLNLSRVLLGIFSEDDCHVVNSGLRTVAQWESLCELASIAETLLGEQLFLEEIWSIRLAAFVPAVAAAIKNESKIEELDRLKANLTQCMLTHERLGVSLSADQVFELLLKPSCCGHFASGTMCRLLQWAVVDTLLGCNLTLTFTERCNRLQLCLRFLKQENNCLDSDRLMEDCLMNFRKAGRDSILQVTANLLLDCRHIIRTQQEAAAVLSGERHTGTSTTGDLMKHWAGMQVCLQLVGDDDVDLWSLSVSTDGTEFDVVIDAALGLLQALKGHKALDGTVFAIVRSLVQILEKVFPLTTNSTVMLTRVNEWLSEFVSSWRSRQLVMTESPKSDDNNHGNDAEWLDLIVMSLMMDAPHLVGCTVKDASEFSLLYLSALRATCTGRYQHIAFNKTGFNFESKTSTSIHWQALDLLSSAWYKRMSEISNPPTTPALPTIMDAQQCIISIPVSVTSSKTTIQDFIMNLMVQVGNDTQRLLESLDSENDNNPVSQTIKRQMMTDSLGELSISETGTCAGRLLQQASVERRSVVMQSQQKYWTTALRTIAKSECFLLTPNIHKHVLQFTRRALHMQTLFPLEDWQCEGFSNWEELEVVVCVLDALTKVYGGDNRDDVDDHAKRSWKDMRLEALAAFIGPFGGNGTASRVMFEVEESSMDLSEQDNSGGHSPDSSSVNFKQVCFNVGFELLKTMGPRHLCEEILSIGEQTGEQQATSLEWNTHGTFRVWEPEFVAALDFLTFQKIDLKLAAKAYSLQILDG